MTDPPNQWAADERYPAEATADLAQRLHQEGLIYAINRVVLHPAGLALGVYGELDEERVTIVETDGLMLLSTDDPEGIEYADDGQHERGAERLRSAGHDHALELIERLNRKQEGP